MHSNPSEGPLDYLVDSVGRRGRLPRLKSSQSTGRIIVGRRRRRPRRAHMFVHLNGRRYAFIYYGN